MTIRPTVEADPKQPSTLSPPHSHLAQYLLRPGDRLLDDERLCACGALEGDHQVIDDACPRTGCIGFEVHPDADCEVG